MRQQMISQRSLELQKYIYSEENAMLCINTLDPNSLIPPYNDNRAKSELKTSAVDYELLDQIEQPPRLPIQPYFYSAKQFADELEKSEPRKRKKLSKFSKDKFISSSELSGYESEKSDSEDKDVTNIETKKLKPQRKRKPKKVEGYESPSSSNESDKSLFNTESEDEGEDESEEDPEDNLFLAFKNLPKNHESINLLIDQLKTATSKMTLVILEAFEKIFDPFDFQSLKLISDTSLKHTIINLRGFEEITSKIIKKWRNNKNLLLYPGEDWERMYESLNKSFLNRSNKEIFAALRRIVDNFPENLNKRIIKWMTPLAKLIKTIFDDAEGGEIKLKSQSFLRMWNAKTEKNTKSEIDPKNLRQLMDEKLNQYKSLGKPIVESEEKAKKSINVDPDAVVIKRRRRNKSKPN